MYKSSSPNLDANEDLFRFLVRANAKCEWMWQICIKYVFKGFPIFQAFMTIVSIVICYLIHGAFDTKRLYHPWMIRWVINIHWIEIFHDSSIQKKKYFQ